MCAPSAVHSLQMREATRPDCERRAVIVIASHEGHEGQRLYLLVNKRAQTRGTVWYTHELEYEQTVGMVQCNFTDLPDRRIRLFGKLLRRLRHNRAMQPPTLRKAREHPANCQAVVDSRMHEEAFLTAHTTR